MHRTYSNEDITVFWDSDKCVHAKRCVSSLPGVFDINRKPWIDLSQGENKDIWQTVKKCPVGAVDIEYNHNVIIKLEADKNRSIALCGDEKIGECGYEDTDEGFRIIHTRVKPEYQNKGIARRLCYRVFEEAERNKKPIIPICSYAATLLSPS
ncbi:MAG: GNAT family N-acetyltransferase [Lachnospiraceae bacterium]|nr:GNAT family N-acetyltransferase [Lachnospiraceae bacterium]